MGGSNMHPRYRRTIAWVQTFIEHSPFAESDGIMKTVLDVVESRACAQQISQATYRSGVASGLPEWLLSNQSRDRQPSAQGAIESG
jgi:hypothetical protein